MPYEADYWDNAGRYVADYFDGVTSVPTITNITAIRWGSTFTVTGSSFSGSGNHLFVDGEEVAIGSEGATSIVSVAQEFRNSSLTQAVPVWVVTSGGVQSNTTFIIILPVAGQTAVLISSQFLGSASTRLQADPPVSPNHEILPTSLTGVGTLAQVTVLPNAVMIVPDTVTSVGWLRFDGQSWSAVENTANFSAVTLSTIVPNGIGLLPEEAHLLAVSAVLVDIVVGSRRDPVILFGLICDQYPPATTVVQQGSTWELTTSLGRTGVLAPPLIGLNFIVADGNVAAAGLTGSAFPYVDGFNSGLVVNQSVAAGTLMNLGDPLDFAYSTDRVNVLGYQLAEGISILIAANVLVDDDFRSDFDSSPYGTIIAQDPLPDASVTPGTTFFLTFSLGPNAQLVGVAANRGRMRSNRSKARTANKTKSFKR